MASYISSNANRFYVALEASYGQAAPITAANRFPAVRLHAQQRLELGKRLDKTGTRTFLGTSKDSRRQTAFEARTYLTSWNGSAEPSYGPLFQAALGAPPRVSSGLTVSASQNSTQLETSTPHGLEVGSGVSFANEIRFVTNVPDPSTIFLNAPFSTTPGTNAALASVISYTLSSALPSLTLYDYWDPTTAVSRIVTGAAVNHLEVLVNGDYHEFLFNGPAADLIDSNSFNPGMGGLSSYPSEPSLQNFDYSIVPGHLGQVWLGSGPDEFFTLTSAAIVVTNSIDVRNRDFGSSYPRAIAPGIRVVSSEFTLLAQDDAQTAALYAAAKGRNPVPAMIQLGQQQRQIMAFFMPSVIPEIPDYNDSEPRLQWAFKNNRAQGSSNDEIAIAFA
jgi:hypothetical protein